jgi:hypothetical protein
MPRAPADFARLDALLRAGDASGLTVAIAACAGEPPERVGAMVACVLAREQPPEALGLAPLPAALLRVAIEAGRSGAEVPARVGPELDEVWRENGPADWSAARLLAFLRLRAIAPTGRAAVVATMRDDGLSALEFVAHYRALGFAAIFIYSNDNVDGSDGLLRCLHDHGVITYIDNAVGPETHPQRKAFAHALHMLPALRRFEWVFFLDSDEFFVPAPDPMAGIGDVLDGVERRFGADLPAALCYHWRWYLSAARYAWSPGLLLERFQHARAHRGLKSLARLPAVASMCRLHTPIPTADERLAQSDLALFAADAFENREPVYSGGQLNHFWVKSFEEFSIKKARGDALRLAVNDYARGFELFFKWNGEESAANLAAPPAALVARVKAEMARLAGLPGMARALREVRDRIPAMMARFDGAGGLRKIYEAARDLAGKA